jgi:hypothetical protein
MRLAPACAVALALLCVSLAVAPVASLTTKITAGSEDCFHEWAAPGVTINVAFAVTHGGKLDVDAKVRVSFWGDTQHMIVTEELQTWTAASEGHAEFRAPTNSGNKPTKMEICISNKMARWTPKWVNFEFYKLLPAADDGIQGSHNERFKDVEDRLHDNSRTVYEMRMKMQKLRQVEEDHRNTVESTNSWLFYGALCNGVLLAMMAIFQFWYLKNFLTVRNAVMRM